DDIGGVLDAAASERAVILATTFAGFIAAVFAASHPDRTAGLVLCDAFATFSATEETPWMPTPDEWEGLLDRIRETGGTSEWTDRAPDWSTNYMDEHERDWFIRWQRSACAPGALIASARRHMHTDIRGVLSSIHVPTLVISDTDGRGVTHPDSSRFLAE